MEEGKFEEQKISKFNSTIAILYRIDSLWKDAHIHSRSGKLMKWNWDLDRIWCELACDANLDDEQEFKKLNDDVLANYKNPVELYKNLLKKEIFLRKLQNKQGKGVAYEESLDNYLD